MSDDFFGFYQPEGIQKMLRVYYDGKYAVKKGSPLNLLAISKKISSIAHNLVFGEESQEEDQMQGWNFRLQSTVVGIYYLYQCENITDLYERLLSLLTILNDENEEKYRPKPVFIDDVFTGTRRQVSGPGMPKIPPEYFLISLDSGVRELSEEEFQAMEAKRSFFDRANEHYHVDGLEYVERLREIVFHSRWEKNSLVFFTSIPQSISKMRKILSHDLIILNEFEMAAELCKIAHWAVDSNQSTIGGFGFRAQRMMGLIACWDAVNSIEEMHETIRTLHDEIHDNNDQKYKPKESIKVSSLEIRHSSANV